MMRLDKIRRLREARGLTQADLASRASVSRQGLGLIEAGKVDPSLSLVVALARALGTTVDALLDDDDADSVEATGEARAGDRVVLAQGRSGWVAHALSANDGEQPADGTVATANPRSAKVALFGAPEASNVVMPGCAPILGLAAQRLNLRRGARYTWLHRTSQQALAALERGDTLLAAVHGERPRRERHERVPCLTWQSGLIVPVGNPRRLTTIADVLRRTVTVAVREPGAETRRLFDSLLEAAGHASPPARARVAFSHGDVARAVMLGSADLGFGPRTAALAAGLDFVPLAEERFDFVTPKASLDDPRVVGVLDLVRSRGFRAEANVLGYDLPTLGER